MRIYFDPNFTFNELMDYYAPIIITTKDEKYIDLHSLSIINLLGVIPKMKGLEEIDGLFLNFLEFDEIEIPQDNLLKFSQENFEKFKISNIISLRQMYQSSTLGQFLLRLENTPNNVEFLVLLCSQYVINNREFFQDKKFEIILEMIIFIELKKFAEKKGIKFSMPQPFIFLFDLSNVSLKETHLLLDEVEVLNQVVTRRVPVIFNYCKDKVNILEKLFQSIDRSSFSKLLYAFASIDDIINDFLILKNLLSEIESLENI